MNNQDYEKAKEECWNRLNIKAYDNLSVSRERYAFEWAFNHAYRLGMKAAKKEQQTEPQEKKPLTMKPIIKKTAVYLATKEEDEEFRQLLHDNGYQWCGGDSLLKVSEWVQKDEEAKIHFVYPDGSVTYCGDKDNETLTLQEFKDLYTEPQKETGRLYAESVEESRIASEEAHLRDLLQEVAKSHKDFDDTIKRDLQNERRLNTETQILCAMLTNPAFANMSTKPTTVVELATKLTEIFLNKSQKGDKQI